MNMRMYAALLVVLAFAGVVGCEDRDNVKALEAKISELTNQVSPVAYLTPGSNGYSVVESDLGRMAVALDNVEAYANGSRVTLRFGNLTSATVNRAKAKIEWGNVDKEGRPQDESARSRELTFPESLRAGAWTNVPVVLEGVQPTELGFVRIRKVGHTGISLSR
jgi:hypothetical protein